jgi:hypothetical protein
MPTVIVENVPVEVYQRLQQRAAFERRSLPEVTLQLLQQALRAQPRLPDLVPGEEIPAPGDLPRSSVPVVVISHQGQPRFPDPVQEEPPLSEAR